MSPREWELTRPRAGLAVLAALLLTACGGGVPTKGGSTAAGPQSSPGPAGAPADGAPQPGTPGSPTPENGGPPGGGTNPPQDTSGWARDSNGNLIGPTGW